MENYFLVISSLAGALTQEVVHWYDLRTKFDDTEVKSLLKSPGYWIITILMIFLSGIGVWFLFGEKNPSRDILFLMGAGFPLIFKKLVVTFSKKDQTNLGSTTISKYFERYSFKKQ